MTCQHPSPQRRRPWCMNPHTETENPKIGPIQVSSDQLTRDVLVLLRRFETDPSARPAPVEEVR